MTFKNAYISCNIIDIINGQILENHTIIVNTEGVIEYIIPTQDYECSNFKISEAVNLKEKWVMPGLIDLHVHIAEESSKSKVISYSYDEDELTFAFRAANNLTQAINSGITLLRDVGAYNHRNLRVKNILNAGIFHGPRLISCGNLLTFPGGHYSTRGREVTGLKDIRLAVQEEIKDGADFIKVINDPIGFSEDDLKTIVDEAHNFGVIASCHAFTEEGIILAVNSGFDTIEHGVPVSEQTLDIIKKNKIILIPTHICAVESSDPFIYREIVEKRDFIAGDLNVFERWLALQVKWLPKIFSEDLLVAVGTDAGFLSFDSAIKEMKLFTYYGASNLQALRAGTITAATATNLSKKIGCLEPGRFADFIVLNSNPINSLDALDEIMLVSINGDQVINKLT